MGNMNKITYESLTNISAAVIVRSIIIGVLVIRTANTLWTFLAPLLRVALEALQEAPAAAPVGFPEPSAPLAKEPTRGRRGASAKR